MPFDGSFNFTLTYDWTTDRDNGVPIQAARMDTQFEDIAAGLNALLPHSGAKSMSGDLNMGTNDIVNAGTGAFAGAVTFAAGISVTAGNISAGALTGGGTFSVSGSATAPRTLLTGVAPVRVTSPSGWSGASATVFAGLSATGVGVGDYTGISAPAGKGIAFVIDTQSSLLVDSNGILPFSTTTASAANLYQSASNTVVLRSTSSARYKRDVETLDPTYNKVMDLRPVFYRSKAEADNPKWGYWGLIAEEVAKVDPKLVHYVDGVPDGVQYERVCVLLLDVIKRMDARLTALEG